MNLVVYKAGIQGITESQAEIISTYLNSLRFFVADNNSVMKQLRDYVIGTDDMQSYACSTAYYCTADIGNENSA